MNLKKFANCLKMFPFDEVRLNRNAGSDALRKVITKSIKALTKYDKFYHLTNIGCLCFMSFVPSLLSPTCAPGKLLN